MKKSLIILSALFCGTVAFAQQVPQFTQYMQNIYVLNPAASGLTDYVDVNLSFRQQWQGFSGAPKTYYITGNSLLGRGSMGGNKIFALRVSDPYISLDDKEVAVDNDGTVVNRKVRHAVGASLVGDKAGALTTNFGAVSYAVHVPIAEKMNLSAGVKAGLSTWSINPNDLATGTNNDALANNIINGNNQNTEFDLNLGLLLYGDKFFLGYSTSNLLANDLQFGSMATNASAYMHHYLTGGYRWEIGSHFGLTPSAIVKMAKNSPTSADFSAKMDFERKFWFGLSYRTKDALAAIAGVRVGNYINVGYSYDYTTSELNNVSSGSHEFLLNIMLGKK